MQNKMRRSSLFLLELIISIFFLSLACAICVRFFVTSYSMTQDSKDLDRSVNQASSCAEIFQNQEDALSYLNTIYPDSTMADNRLQIYYNKDWEPCTQMESIYLLTMELTSAKESSNSDRYDVAALQTAAINVTKQTTGDVIYRLTSTRYVGGEQIDA